MRADIITFITVALGITSGVGGALMLAASEQHRLAARVAIRVTGGSVWFLGVLLAMNQPSLGWRMAFAAVVGAVAAASTVLILSLADEGPSRKEKVAMSTPADKTKESGLVVGLDVSGDHQGGVAMDIQSTGTAEAPSLGGESVVHAPAGQGAIGTRIIQSGPGTGMRVIQNGPGVGFRSVVITGPLLEENK